MIRGTRLAAAFALCAGLTLAGAAPAQTQDGSVAPPGSIQPAPPQEQPATVPDPDASQQVYSVPQLDNSNPDLPRAVGGYARSVAGCVLIGCNDDGSPDTPSPVSDEPQPPDNPPPANPH
jgi:hypothetical protein